MRSVFFACIGAVFVVPAVAQDKKETPAEPTTTWEREVQGVILRFQFTPETLKITGMIDENGFVATCKITRGDDGLVKVKITKVEEKGQAPAKPSVGTEFSFKWKEKGDTAVLSDLKGEEVEDAREFVEGEYKKLKPKK